MNIVIIGAGVAGLSIGWRLRQAGAAVTILERAQPAGGATWAAAGMLALAAELETSPPAEIEFALYSNGLWSAFAVEVEESSGRAIDLARPGALLLGDDPAAMASRAAADPALTFLTVGEVRARWPMLTGEYSGGLWARDEAHVDNRALGQALTIAFLKAGGVLKPNEAVVNILSHGGRTVGVATPFTRYPADAVVLAAGAWSGQVADVPVIPVKGEMIALTPPADAPFDFAGPVVWGQGVYLVPRNDRLLVGATMAHTGFDTGLSHEAVRHLRARAAAVIPALAGWHLDEHWAGLRPGSPDGLPLLGPSRQPGLFIASGQYRNGILFTPAIARLMADMVLGKAEPIPAFDPRRFKDKTP
ncbi:MAG TPA: glycine oxidase ThiO [Rhizomicrobium sp.]|jgi:glycine oxidase|nr:glycine oxidase ThiO [Rhizomicrobium sp.]